MGTVINLKQAQKWLMKKDLHEFVKEMWDSYDPSPFSDSWLVEYLCECYMYSLRQFLPNYCWGWWITDEEYEAIKKKTGGHCDVRDHLLPDGQHTRNHDINIAPRHCKSSIFNVLGPAWTIINTPITVTSVSHSMKLSGEMVEKKQKLFNSEKFAYYFGDDPSLKLLKNTAQCIELRNGGKTYSVAMKSFTGFGSDCFVAGTTILSRNGYINIEDINIGDEVLSYNIVKGRYEISRIVAKRRIEDRETGIAVTDSGRQVECTPDHRFWVEDRGYQEISKIEEGSRFSTCSLQNMRETYIRFKRVLQNLLRETDEDTYLYEMRFMWEYCNAFFDGVEKTSSKGEVLLFKDLSSESEQYKETIKDSLSQLFAMWKDWSSKFSKILLTRMQKNCGNKEKRVTKQTNRSVLQELWKIVLNTCEFKQDVLFRRMRETDAFKSNAWGEQSELQRIVSQLSSRILGHKSKDIGEGWILLSMLSFAIDRFGVQQEWERIFENKSNSSPQRQRQIQQFRAEFNNIMFEMPYKNTQERLREWRTSGERKTVYDIQVEPNNNFFANNILVHNCIINDDLISVADARQDGAVLLKARDYFKTTMPSRLNNKTTGVIMNIMQRIGRGDISDLIAEDKGLRKIYSHTELQAIADHDETIIFPCSGKVKIIKKGDLLWPERFGDYSQLKMEIGAEDFETQYNQRPSKNKLNVIQDDYIHYISDKEYEEFKLGVEFHYGSHDCPVKDKETSDFHGFCEGESRANELVITDAFEKHLSYIKEKELLTNLQTVDPSILQIVEDKANGAALIQDLAIDVPGLVAFNPGTKSKMQRLELASVYMQQGLVRFRRSERIEELILHLKKFPLLEHDDMVDAFSQLVIYHFTQRHLGVYSGAFNFENIVDPITRDEKERLFMTYGATIKGEVIKVVGVSQDMYKDVYIVEKEYTFSSIMAYEEFCRTIPAGCTVYDASPQNRLSSLVTNVFNNIKFIDQDRDKSINILKTGFYKKKVKVSRECKQTINDIARMRVTESSRERGVDQTETLDEGMAGCLRAVITAAKGYSLVWY